MGEKKMPRATTIATTALALLTLTLTSPQSRAAQLLDAHYAPVDTTFVSAVAAPPNYAYEDKAQTFTVLTTGTLSQLDLLLQRGVGTIGTPSGNLHWDIRPLLAGVPNPDAASALITGDIPASAIPADAPSKTYVSVTNLALPVTAGQQLAIVLHNDGTNYFGWGAAFASPTDPYTGGSAFDRFDPANTPAFSPIGFDHAFRTFVTPIPDPASCTLLAAAFPLLTLRRRNR